MFTVIVFTNKRHTICGFAFTFTQNISNIPYISTCFSMNERTHFNSWLSIDENCECIRIENMTRGKKIHLSHFSNYLMAIKSSKLLYSLKWSRLQMWMHASSLSVFDCTQEYDKPSHIKRFSIDFSCDFVQILTN